MRELKAYRLKREIAELNAELYKHQDRCKHAKATKKSSGNTGHYDPSADRYWDEFDCPTCLKKWHVDTTSY